ncbi:unnamed protein product [Brassicogethes aeneus]|uniref:Acylphosphatase n=1 Tax=Brassicogethes aeneus TaxID=1431903 RepID=A0A9P0FE71_BRAAE|nr:unnamed protein product [Brassicogethes aeneus]
MSKLLSVEFEIFGIVQGVFFRKNAEKQANSLALKGWVKNSSSGTVEGVLEGPSEAVNEMKYWLQHKGSPESRIDQAVFLNEKEIENYTFDNFFIKRS